MAELLEVKSLTKRFGGLVAVNGISFVVREGEILSVIGPNGAGKSTLFKLIASFMRPSDGEVLLRGARISGLAPHIVARAGVVRTFQETTIFKGMSVRDNVIIAHHLRSRASLLGFYAGSKSARADESDFARSADEILDFLGLGAIATQLASTLPQGHLRALGIAIGLATNPTILLLDEPFAGMNHDETRRAVQLVRAVRERGVTILLVEQNANMALKVADYGYVLEVGRIVMADTCAQLMAKDDIREFYLGFKEGGARGQRRWKKRKTWR
jgi:branched-chain amino acid transport system ATP-binding protein